MHQCYEATTTTATTNINHLHRVETVQFVNRLHEARKFADNEGAPETIDASGHTGYGLAIALCHTPLGLRGPLELLIRVDLAAHSLVADDGFLRPFLTIELGLIDRLRVHTEESFARIHKHSGAGRAPAQIATLVLHVVG